MSENDAQEELAVFQTIVSGLAKFEKDTQARILQSVMTFIDLHEVPLANVRDQTTMRLSEPLPAPVHSFQNTSTVDPKHFLLEKAPHTDMERVVCLAFYLTHYRDTPHFTTLEISKLNTEAAQPKFANAAQAVKNATNRGFIVPSLKGKKQIGAMGEQFVQSLPDRDAAKQLLQQFRSRKPRKSVSKAQRQASAATGRTPEKA